MSPASARHRRQTALVAVIAVVLLGLTVLATGLPGTGDMEIWERWMANARRLGVVAGFAENGADYPPLASVFLWMAGRAGSAFGLVPCVSIKVSLAVFLGLTLLAFVAQTRHGPATLGLWAALGLNSAALGYLDIYTAPFLVLSLGALSETRNARALAWFTLACAVKWQPGLIAPFLLIHAVGTGRRPRMEDMRRVLRALVPASLVLLVLLLTFGVLPVALSFAKSLGHRSLSAEALNLGWLLTWVRQGLEHGAEGWLGRVVYLASVPIGVRWLLKALFAALFAMLIRDYARGPASAERTVAYAMAGFLAYIAFSNGVHENHWFVPCVLAVWLASRHPAWTWPAIALGAIANLNLLLFYGVTGQGPGAGRVIGIDVSVPLAAAAIAVCVWVWMVLRDQEVRYSSIRQ